MEVLRLTSVDGFIVLDLPGAASSAGGTRLARDVTVEEVALLARAMTYKFAVLDIDLGGAKGGLRGDPSDGPAKAELLARYCAEIGPLVESRRFLTGPDMGTTEEDFASLRGGGDRVPSVVSSIVDGLPFDDAVTGLGVVVAAESAIRGFDDRTVAIEGFGKVGGGVARETVRRGGRVVAVSTLAGCVHNPSGHDVDHLFLARAEHGDDFVSRLGLPTQPADRLYEIDADVIVPGARTGVLDERRATALSDRIRVVSPGANAPYTAAGLAVLRAREIAALPDFVCNAGAVIAYRSPRHSTAEDVLAAVERRITELTTESMAHSDGPYAGACARAEAFLRTWWGDPPGPPLA